MGALAEVKEEIESWNVDDVVEALGRVEKGRSKAAVRERLEALQSLVQEHKEELETAASTAREEADALDEAVNGLDELDGNINDAIARLEEE